LNKKGREELLGAITRYRAYVEENPGNGEDIANFFTNPGNGLQNLIPVVQKILCTPASSAAAERSFSSTGFLQSGRETLGSGILEKLAVVRDYMAQPHFNLQKFVLDCVQHHVSITS